VLHISIWGGLGALFGGLSPPKPPVATELISLRLTTYPNIFQTRWETNAYIISCILQQVAQELDKINILVYVCASFVDLLRESVF